MRPPFHQQQVKDEGTEDTIQALRAINRPSSSRPATARLESDIVDLTLDDDSDDPDEG